MIGGKPKLYLNENKLSYIMLESQWKQMTYKNRNFESEQLKLLKVC